MYDLELAKHEIIISNIPSYYAETIAEYSVSIALQLVRKFPTIENVCKHIISHGRPLLCLVQQKYDCSNHRYRAYWCCNW